MNDTTLPLLPFLDGPRLAAMRADPVLRTISLLILPISIVAYYYIFSFSIYVSGVLLLALIALISSSGTGVPYRTLWPLIGLYGWWALSVRWSPYPDAAFNVATAGVYALYSLVAAPFKVRFGDLFPLRLMMLCALATALCALYSFYEVGTVIDEAKGSMRSLFAAFFLAGFPASVFLAIRHRSVLAIGTILLVLAVGLQLGSRTFILLTVPAVLATLMVVGRTSRFFQLARYPIVLLVGLAGLLIFVEAAAFSGSEIFEAIGRGTSFQIDQAVFVEARNPSMAADDLERRLLVVVGLDSFEQNPLIGAGFMSTPFYLGQYYSVERSAHGLPLFLLGETGLIGTALFLCALIWSVRGYVRHAKQLDPDAATIAYVELVTLGIIITNGMFHQVYSDFYFFLFLGLGLWRLRLAQQTAASSRKPSLRSG